MSHNPPKTWRKRPRALWTVNSPYGDTLITATPETVQRPAQEVKEFMTQHPKDPPALLLRGFHRRACKRCQGLVWIAHTARHGPLYGNATAKSLFPRTAIHKGTDCVLGANVSIALEHQQTQYLVLVEPKQTVEKVRPFLMPPGGMCNQGEAFRAAGLREMQEETGLRLNVRLNPMGLWNHSLLFMNMHWIGWTYSFYCQAKMPEEWAQYLTTYTTHLVFPSHEEKGEIECIHLIDKDMFLNVGCRQALKEMGIPWGSLGHRLCMDTINRLTPLPAGVLRYKSFGEVLGMPE
jgi:8-oxo-dGTP pyrophosphatase MutT (NUDIX family)